MTVGLPCVLSDIPSHREVITKTVRPMGFTFDNRKMNSLLNAIQNVLKLDVESTARSIRDVFEKHYTAKHMSEQYQEEYVKIMKK